MLRAGTLAFGIGLGETGALAWREDCMKFRLIAVVAFVLAGAASAAGDVPGYKSELNIPFCTVNGKELKMNAFLPVKADKPSPVMVDIHGGWWTVGEPTDNIQHFFPTFTGKGIAIFAISYRLGKEGGFPENIRDCRNAIRFIRKNAARFNIDPERIGCMGGSAGSHLSMMCAMVPEDFNDGGPTQELKGISAKVCNAYSFVGPTDFVRQWDEAPEDRLPDGTFRPADDNIHHDARPRHRILHHGIIPDTEEHRALYRKMSPIGHVRKDIAPLLIVDGERDDIVPHAHGKYLHQKLKEAGADSTYFLMEMQGHVFPRGAKLTAVLDPWLNRTLKIEEK